MTMPRVGQRVHIANRNGVFVVLRVDAEHRLVDLVELSPAEALIEDVSLESIVPCSDPGGSSAT